MNDFPYVNEVSLVGRLSDTPLVKTLPSGDLIMLWRLIVDRPAAELRTPRRVVDTINCVTFDDRLFGPAHEWRPDQLLEIHGALRRRFWPGGSRCEVVVHHAVPAGDATGPPESPVPASAPPSRSTVS
jgi:single-stranded DNA-binding protein